MFPVKQSIQHLNLTYDNDLPIVQRREEIAEIIRHHQVAVVCGETGSGKSTQLPKICLEIGRHTTGMIGHTQPRRIAARSIAARIAEELNTPLGQVVGYEVRFDRKVSADTLVKLMTDGILLAESQSDKNFRKYGTIIIDEAHERSLNIDFLLGMMKRVLPHRPELKLIITSATIDAKRFAEHFTDRRINKGQPVPVIEVSGRTFPVEIRYRDNVSVE
jgi:ATP-dependent helicase HrpA